MSNDPKPLLRCAIYTRKSSEEGLKQSFNSLPSSDFRECPVFSSKMRSSERESYAISRAELRKFPVFFPVSWEFWRRRASARLRPPPDTLGCREIRRPRVLNSSWKASSGQPTSAVWRTSTAC